MNKIPLRVFLIGHGSYDLPKLPYGHREVLEPALSDAVFWWAAPDNLTPRVGLQLGIAIALERAVQVAFNDPDINDKIRDAFGTNLIDELKFPWVRSLTPMDGYERVMADLDALRPSRFYSTELQDYARCAGCHRHLVRGTTVMRSVFQGVYHPECHALKFHPKEPNEVLFNMELVSVLRSEVARLEEENERLRPGVLHK